MTRAVPERAGVISVTDPVCWSGRWPGLCSDCLPLGPDSPSGTPIPAHRTTRLTAPATRRRRVLRWRAITTPARLSPGHTSSSSYSSAILRLNSSSAWMDTAISLLFVVQELPQLIEPSARGGLDGAFGDVQRDGGLGHRRIEQVAADEHLALDVGQLAQHADQHVTAVYHLGERDHVGELVQVLAYLRVPAAVPPAFTARVYQHGPGVGRRRLFGLLPPPVGAQQRNLERVLGILPGIEQYQGRAQQRGGCSLDELGEFRVAAGSRAGPDPSHGMFNAGAPPWVPANFASPGNPRRSAARAGSGSA